MKAKLLFSISTMAAVCWALAVIMVGTQHGFILQPYLDSPWSSGLVGIGGGFMIGICGLRMYTAASYKESMRRLQKTPMYTVAEDRSYALDPCQMTYHEPYIVTERAAR